MLCPKCGSSLELSLVPSERGQERPEEVRPFVAPPYAFHIAGYRFELDASDIMAAVNDVHREVSDSYVEIPASGGVRRLPTKDLLRQAILRKYPETPSKLLTGSSFTSQAAERIMKRIGFEPKRRFR